MPRKLTETERKKRQLRPRKRGDGSVYWVESRQRFRASVVASRPGAKIERKTVSGKTAFEVEEKVERLKADLVKGRRTARGMTLTRWIEQWLENGSHKPSTRRGYRSLLTQFVMPSIGGKKLEDIDADDVLALHKFMERKKVSSTTIGHAHRLCSAALNEASRQQRGGTNFFAILKPPKNAATTMRAFDEKEIKRFLETIHGVPDEGRWLAAVYLGMRQGEVLGMTWDCVDLTSEIPTITIQWQLSRVPYLCHCVKPCKTPGRNCPTKTLDIDASVKHRILVGAFCLISPKTIGSKRVIPIPELMLGPLERRRAEYLEERKKHGYQDFGLVWSRGNGKPIDHAKDNGAWHRLLDVAEIDSMPLHSARHTAASVLLRAGVDPSISMALMGHSSYITTSRYQTTDAKMLARALNKAIEKPAIPG
ncbi:MAG TPA: site-specific integrase [Aeromicrobium sp.]|nr:site-specific integrase [Aeromicrobium sp.]